MLSINSTLKGYDYPDKDFTLKFYFSNGESLYLIHYHEQDCCEDVAADWDEIPHPLLQELKGLYITSFELKPEPKGEGGFLMIFNHTPIEDPKLPEELWINRKSILVGCHNIQNGYYNDDLEIKAIKLVENENTLTLSTKQGLKFSKEIIED